MPTLFNSLAAAASRGLAALFVLAALTFAAPAETLRVAVLSDMNGSYGSTRYQPDVLAAVRRVVATGTDLVVLNGDMVAGQRQPPLEDAATRAMWASFHHAVTTPLARAGIAVAPVPGNHDASARRGFAAERQIYADEWAGRKPAVNWIDDRHYPFHYAFALRGTLFVMLDTTRAGPLPRDQIDWLSDLLANHRFPTTIIFGHMPLWPTAEARENEIVADPALKAVLERHGADLHVSGHHHIFYAGAAGGVAYVTNPSLGGPPRQPLWPGARAGHGFTMIEVAGDGHVTVRPLASPGFMQAPGIEALPPSLKSVLGRLVRLDLVPGSRVSVR